MLTVILIIFCCCFLVERLFPGWKLPDVQSWPKRVVLINLTQLGVVLFAGISWEAWLSSWSVFKLPSYFGAITGGLFAYFVATFVFYWWHRGRHESDFLWRITGSDR